MGYGKVWNNIVKIFLPGRSMHIISIETFRIKSRICMELRNKTTELTHFGFFYAKSKSVILNAVIFYLLIWSIVFFPWLLAWCDLQKYKYNTQKSVIIYTGLVVSSKRWVSFMFNENGMDYLFCCIPNLFNVFLNKKNVKLATCHEYHPSCWITSIYLMQSR